LTAGFEIDNTETILQRDQQWHLKLDIQNSTPPEHYLTFLDDGFVELSFFDGKAI